MANVVYLSKTLLTGGTAPALDSIDGTGLVNGDFAHVTVAGVLYVYKLNATLGGAESIPTIISPDTNAGNKRWVLQGVNANGLTDNSLTASLPLFTGANKEVVSKSVADAMAVLGLPGEIKMYGGSSAPSGWLFCDASAINRTTYAVLYAVIGTTFGVGDGSTTFNVPDMRGRVPIGAGTGTGGGASGTGLPTGGTALTARALGAWTGTQAHALAEAELAAHVHTVDPPSTASGTESADHTHTGSGTSAGRSTDHSHNGYANIGVWSDAANANIAGGSAFAVAGGHDVGGSTADHTHTYSFTSSGKSATHTHSTDIAQFNSGSIGSGTAHETMQPTMCLNFMIKT